MGRAGKRVIEAAGEAAAMARGEAVPGAVLHTPQDVRATRAAGGHGAGSGTGPRGARTGGKEYYLRDGRLISEAEALNAARDSLAVKAAVRTLERSGGVSWAISTLRDELDRLTALEPKKRGRPVGRRALRKEHLILVSLALGTLGMFSSRVLAARLDSAHPGRFGNSVDAIAKSIARIRGRDGGMSALTDLFLAHGYALAEAKGWPRLPRREMLRLIAEALSQG